MGGREPVTRTIGASEARQQFSQLVNQVFRREARVIVEKSGIAVAAIVAAEDLERLQDFEKRREQDFKALDDTREAFKDVPDEELAAEVDKAVASVRKKLRRKVGAPPPA